MPTDARPLISASQFQKLPRPYLLFLGEEGDLAFAKTACGLRDWAPEACIGELACRGARASIGLTALAPSQARARGAQAVVIGVANVGGTIPDAWMPPLLECLAAGLDIISGMHGRLDSIPVLKAAAEGYGRRLIDVRVAPTGIPIATGRKRTGKRLLTVGTDCALGKKYTALSLTREFRARGVAADFRATGQTGILIAGEGIPIDAIVADFCAGAAEILTPDATASHWDVVEGQGSLFHPSYAGVSLALLHGTQPDVVVLCHQAGRQRLMGLEDFAVPELEEAIELTLMLGRRTNPRLRCAGVALDTSHLELARASETLARYSARLGLPIADPMRRAAELDRLVDACLA